MLALAGVFVLAVWYSQAGLLLLTGLFLSTAGLARLWNRISLVGVQAERSLNGTRFFPGEVIECRLRLFNRKPLPLPWVQIENRLPAGVELASPASGAEAVAIRRTASLLWYRSISWKLNLVGKRRGYFPVGPLKLTSGDLLGLYSRSRRTGTTEHLIVYPRIYPVDTRFIPSLHPGGEFQTAKRLFRDPTHTIGVREYHRNDSLRFIHWKATARRGDLQVKVLATTTSFKVAIFLDVESFRRDNAFADGDFELGISVAGSIAAVLCERGNPVGLFVNTRLADSGQAAVIPAAAGRRRVMEILEALAKTTERSSGPAAFFLEAQKGYLTAGTTLILILARPTDALSNLLIDLKEAGFKLLVILVGGASESKLPSEIAWHRVRHTDDLSGGPPP
jgi:uncharacterized protein (DUF58 family)